MSMTSHEAVYIRGFAGRNVPLSVDVSKFLCKGPFSALFYQPAAGELAPK